MVEYKGDTVGPIDFDPKENTSSGTVSGLKDVIHFEVSTAKELVRTFRGSIDSGVLSGRSSRMGSPEAAGSRNSP